jgi:hypothetical protein
VTEELESAGYRVLTAAEVQAGLRWLQSDARIDLLLTDVGLPGGLNGRQVANAGRVSRPALKVLFITGLRRQCGRGQRTAGRRDGGGDHAVRDGGVGGEGEEVGGEGMIHFRNSGEIRLGRKSTSCGQTTTSTSTPIIGSSMIMVSFSASARRISAILQQIIRHRP